MGLLTGIAGVGGGFAIVPALVLLAGLPMQLACGTSLLLIVVNALVALAALGHWPQSLRQGFAALLIGSALLSGSEAPRRQFDLQTGGNRSGNSTRQAWRPVDGGHDRQGNRRRQGNRGCAWPAWCFFSAQSLRACSASALLQPLAYFRHRIRRIGSAIEASK